MNVGVDTPVDTRAASGTTSCPGNRVGYTLIWILIAVALAATHQQGA